MNTKHPGFHILRLILVVCLTLILAGAIASSGKDEIFPLAKIKPGLSGYGYTVFQGLKIEKFNVKVLALTQNEKQSGPLILVRLSGRALQKNGGLSAGMSGSPVYISGKLAGAISYGLENADPFLAMVTPIEEMLKLIDSSRSAAWMGPVSLDELRGDGLTGPDISIPSGSPVLVSGMGQRGYQLVRRSLAGYGLQALVAPSISFPNVNLDKVALAPGSAIGAQMIGGDYQMAAIGTVTMIDPQSGNFLAFGHPFTNRGTVDYLAVACYILQTVKSPALSFKLGAPLKTVGRIIQDRQTGILGRLGETPNLIGVTVKVQDQERRLERQSSFQVIPDEELYPELIVAGVTDAIDQTLNRLGMGTATVNLRITLGAPVGATGAPVGATGAPSGSMAAPLGKTGDSQNPTTESFSIISRENLFFGKDIAADCLEDLQKALVIIAGNEYTAVLVRSVELTIKVQPEQITARILKLSGPQGKVKRGETVTFLVAAHSYRGTDISVPIEVKLPVDLEPGKLAFTVRGGFRGGSGGEGDGQSKRTSVTSDSYPLDKNSLPSLLADYQKAPKNNEFVLEYQPQTSLRSTEDSGGKGMDSAKSKPIQFKAAAGYFILGEAQFTLEVIQE